MYAATTHFEYIENPNHPFDIDTLVRRFNDTLFISHINIIGPAPPPPPKPPFNPPPDSAMSNSTYSFLPLLRPCIIMALTRRSTMGHLALRNAFLA